MGTSSFHDERVWCGARSAAPALARARRPPRTYMSSVHTSSTASAPQLARRIAALGGVALAVAALLAVAAVPAQAQEAPAPQARPGLRSTYVVPSMPGEAVRVTIYARRPPEQGRLARRYRGLRANRTQQASVPRVVQTRPVERTFSTPQHSFVKRGGSFFQVLPRQ